uniref:hypothetical protein n=1 Tax=Microbacterium sp. MMO-79 TaxID=3081285 RepID=UPI0030170808
PDQHRPDGHEPEIDVDKPEPRLAEHARPPAETTQRKAKRGSTESRRWIRAQYSEFADTDGKVVTAVLYFRYSDL